MHRISGLTPVQERLYRHLLGIGRATAQELEEEFGPEVHSDLRELTLRGLAIGDPPVPRRPSEALQGVIDARSAELQAIRTYVADLDSLYDSAHTYPGGEAVQVLTTRTSVQRWYQEIYATSHREVLQLITHPFLPLVEPAATSSGGGHHTRCRVICEWRVFENQKAMQGLRHSSGRGCEIRLADKLPHKLLIGDKRLAMTPRFPRGHSETRQMLLVHPGTLMDFMVAAFETEWQRALPLQANPDQFDGNGGGLDDDEMVIVDMMSRGVNVERIASALNVHARTVNRRVEDLKRRAGVSTLFQLGAYAARHWLRLGSAPAEDA